MQKKKVRKLKPLAGKTPRNYATIKWKIVVLHELPTKIAQRK